MRNTLQSIAVYISYMSLFFGAMGQAAMLGGLKLRYHETWIALVLVPVVMLPWLIVFSVTYFNRPFVSPRTFCICLYTAMIWYVAVTLFAETLLWCDVLPPDSPQYARNIGRVIMHTGWLSFPLLMSWYRSARAQMSASSD